MTGYFSMWILEWYYDYFPSPSFRVARKNSKIATQVSKDLIEAKSTAHLDGMGGRDVLSLIGMFNAIDANSVSKANEFRSQSKPT